MHGVELLGTNIDRDVKKNHKNTRSLRCMWRQPDALRDFLKNHAVNLIGNEKIWHLQAHFDVWLADRLKHFPDHAHILREFVSSTSEVRRNGPTDWTARVFNDELTS